MQCTSWGAGGTPGGEWVYQVGSKWCTRWGVDEPGGEQVYQVGSRWCTRWGVLGGATGVEQDCFPYQVLLDLQARSSGTLKRKCGICQGHFSKDSSIYIFPHSLCLVEAIKVTFSPEWATWMECLGELEFSHCSPEG